MPAVVYAPQHANVLSKGSPFMGEEVEGTAFFAYMQEKELKIKNCELKINFSHVVFEIFIVTKNAQPASAS